MRALVIEDETKVATLMWRGPSAEGHAVDVSVRGESAEVGPARFAGHASAAIELTTPRSGALASKTVRIGHVSDAPYTSDAFISPLQTTLLRKA